MLMGEFPHNMDAKGRVTIPARFREDLGDRFYVTKGLDNCLFVFSPARWERLVEKMASLPIANAHSLQRFFFSGAGEVEPDKQGRVLIPQSLREYAGLSKEVTVIGAATRAEIWDTARWKAYNDSQSQENILAAMSLLGI
ncbi:MAG TPA: division/cell wall cluster transcriptional repressor MraZ [Candidatus Gallacutalibacter pullistercoris]|nr:division/cell wall cluster transcriptional repressor MraZ [Candidatus Gallacutalibacter pullistercoris]